MGLNQLPLFLTLVMGEGDANCFKDLWQKTDNYLSDSAKSTRLECHNLCTSQSSGASKV